MGNDCNYATKYLNDVRSTDELFELALSTDPDRDDERCWQPIAVLQHRLPTILERIQSLAKASSGKHRDTAATILGQGRVRNKYSSDVCAEILLKMLEAEESNEVLSSIIFALGHLHASSAVVALVKLRSHPNPSVRHAVASSLCGHEEIAAVEAMIELSADVDRDVRNWATFGLGSQIEGDTPVIREALCKRLIEADDEIRGEALVGLARRGDVRVVSAFMAELKRNDYKEISDWILFQEASEEIVIQADSTEWLPVLNKLVEMKMGGTSQIQAAIERCK